MKFLKDYSWVFVFVAIVVFGAFIASKPVNTIIQKQAPQMYGGTSPEVSSPYFMVNGVTDWYTKVDMANLTSSTICSIATPAATSTLVYASFNVTSNLTATSIIKAYKSATASATTTEIFGGRIVLNTPTANYASSTSISTNGVFSPSTYLVFDILDPAQKYSPTGNCQAVFRQL